MCDRDRTHVCQARKLQTHKHNVRHTSVRFDGHEARRPPNKNVLLSRSMLIAPCMCFLFANLAGYANGPWSGNTPASMLASLLDVTSSTALPSDLRDFFAACPAFVGVTLPGPLSSGDCFLPRDSLLGLALVPTSVCLPRGETAPSASTCMAESLAGDMPARSISSCCSAADPMLPHACVSPLDADAVPACTPKSWWNAASEMWFVGRFAHA